MKINTSSPIPCIIACLVLLSAPAVYSQAVPVLEDATVDATGLSPLFQGNGRLAMRLEAPYRKLFRKRGKDRPYLPAVLVYNNEKGEELRIELKVRVRGNFRAQKQNCRFPPLKLNFSKKTVRGTLFDGEDKLKLVTHCMSASKYEQFVMLENMAYRMQNLLTDYSLRTRMANVEYVDSGSGKLIASKVAFFIEDQERMAKRNGASLEKRPRIEKTEYDPALLHLATIFEYMLGNTDYSVILGPKGDDCCHNIIPLKAADGSMVPVPYDFDVTGLVNPPYAAPPEHLGIRSLRQRLYRGYCQNTAGFKASFAPFLEQKEATLALFSEDTGLNEKSVQSASRYLEDFYEAIASEEKIVSEFIEKCRS